MRNQLVFKTSNADGPLCGFSTLLNIAFYIVFYIGTTQYIEKISGPHSPCKSSTIRGTLIVAYSDILYKDFAQLNRAQKSHYARSVALK